MASRLTLAVACPRCGDALDAGLSVVCALPAVVVSWVAAAWRALARSVGAGKADSIKTFDPL